MANDIHIPAQSLPEAWRRLDPVKPLPCGSPWYVDCSAERGTHNFVGRMRQAIAWAAEGQAESAFVHDLVVGHRGSGKSTELLRLKDRLERDGFYVHYVDLVMHKDANELDSEAILTVLLRCLVSDLDAIGIQLKQGLLDDIAQWFGERVKTTVGSKSTQVGADVEAALGSKTPLLSLLAKFTGYVRWGTETKDTLTVEYANYLTELRGMVDALLIDAGLQLQKRPQYAKGLVIIADSLDHITLPSRQDEIFIDSAEVLTRLSAHLLLTVPSALLATGRGGEMETCFRKCHWLPIVKVRSVDGAPYADGLKRMRDIIGRRCDLSLFDADALERLCRYSGGHTRHLIRLAQDAIADAAEAPVTLASANRAVAALSNMLAMGRTPEEWRVLAGCDRDPLQRPFSDEGRRLLYHDCLLSHEDAQELDDECIASQWYVVHPALQRLKPFADALAALERPTGD